MSVRPICSRIVLALAASLLPAASRAGVVVTNLVTDDQAVNAAAITDPNFKNPWGMSHSGTSPFWVSDNATGVATLYNVNPATNLPSITPLVITIPDDGTVTGQVFSNTAGNFNGDAFLFVSEDGTISGCAVLWGRRPNGFCAPEHSQRLQRHRVGDNRRQLVPPRCELSYRQDRRAQGKRRCARPRWQFHRPRNSFRFCAFQHSEPGWQDLCHLCRSRCRQARRRGWARQWHRLRI